ncbi:glycosyltransferase family 2 protein [Spirosoma validum]|uniref:Glycosyltransferase n=1 Tax=Spirosoma validum TaxID=2771355 RepID=A0A927AZE4_9BACT|nr:glycosyltransferase [Spirosoma validum]MBD2752579.1 glycosyltransferase [Spirosoma validum]
MFSVIIPLHNKERYIEKAVRSVLEQTFREFELIVIDDGSTDKSRQRLDSISDPRLRVISQPNTGVSIARNRGVDLANYSLIAFLDADDWWHPDFLKELDTLVADYPDAVLYGSNYYYVKHGQNRLEYKGLEPDFTVGYIDYVAIYAASFCVPINCSFVVVRESAFNAVKGFKPSLRMGEDFDLWIRLALLGKVAYVNKPLAYSNQDVDVTQRAIGGSKLYPPQAHVTFNLSFLKPAEEKSPALKKLTDGLRVRSLLPYYLSGQYREPVKKVLKEVNFAHQPVLYRLLYRLPSQLINLYFRAQRVGAAAKQAIADFRRKRLALVR